MSVLLLQMAHAESVEDFGGLDGALPEAVEVDPAPPSATGEDPTPAPAPTCEDASKAMVEPATEDPTAAGLRRCRNRG
jgi:hypothetical protein